MVSRKNFIKTGSLAGLGMITAPSKMARATSLGVPKSCRVGIIGLDTSHSIAFTRALNAENSDGRFGEYKVVAAFPQGSLDIQSSVSRIDGYTAQMKEMGVEITDSIDELLKKSDAILLETNDGRRHLEQAIPVLKAGKRMFIDKPMAASLSDAMAIFDAAQYHGVPVFSSSSLRYIQGMDEIKSGTVGKVLGAETFSPATLEETHPDLFWYGIHGVETLFTVMGTGCKSVTRIFTPDTDVVVGKWDDERIGTFRGIRQGKRGYGGQVFGEKEIQALGSYNGYEPLLEEIIHYFQTGIVPVSPEETLEILAFMEAADESKKNGGKTVELATVMQRARNLKTKNYGKL